MFQMYADGYGQKTIAWTLNGNAAQRELLKRYFVGKQPRPPRAHKPSGAKDWSPHTIHDMLRNPATWASTATARRSGSTSA